MNEAFIGDLLYRAYMIDAITDAEVRQACAMLEIKYPPALLENQNEANRGGNVVMATSEIGQMLDELIAELDGVEK